ncbi:unnamed protein product [Owenia fusiformis]|uniref:Uncharacterized protein n=1 Tax=Owenia fusiformis TaxID=6347 RepID=A0A8S4PX82_OWEFU|nr:unnamed protein product [Owenia fusiformis]
MMLEILLLLACASASVMSQTTMPSMVDLSAGMAALSSESISPGIRTGTELSATALEDFEKHKEANTCKVKLEAGCPRRKGKTGHCFSDVHANCCYLTNPMTKLEDGSFIANSTKVNAVCITNRNWNKGEIDCEDVFKTRVAKYPQCNTSSLRGLLTETDQIKQEIIYICEDKKKMRGLKPNPKTMENKCAPSFYRKMSKLGCCSLKLDADGSVRIVCKTGKKCRK